VSKGKASGLILGIESSCDETAAAVVRGGCEVLSNVVASQIALHANYGGVVPELASREHLKNIVPVVRAAMAEAGVGFADLDAIAVTEGPGLAGALLVGITYAKALALGAGKPLIAVNHLEGHIHAVLMEAGYREQGLGNREQKTDDRGQGLGNRDQKMKDRDQGTGNREQKTEDGEQGKTDQGRLLALVVSGGHTHLYLAEQGGVPDGATTQILSEAQNDASRAGGAGVWRYRNVGRTVDDAAGEAFDKVAKLLGLGYPGGPWMDALAGNGNPRAVEFRFGAIKSRVEKKDNRASLDNPPFPIKPERMGHPESGRHFDFSFSGIKTAVLRYVQTHEMAERVEGRRALLTRALKERPGLRATEALRKMPEVFDQETLDLIASFQYAVAGNLLKQTFAAAEAYGARGIVVSGGVAANSELRRRFQAEADKRGLRVAFPTLAMSTDNAAMIAAAAWGKFAAGDFADEGLVAVPQLKLG
jgi:N6-L-threonylcarbamoyladenine synthase